MPELPEVETVVRGLRGPLAGRSIKEARVYSLKIRTPIPKSLSKTLTGAAIAGVERRAKYILIHLESAQTLVIHLGMTGSLQLMGQGAKTYAPRKHDHLWLRLDNGEELVFADPRRFGVIDLVATAALPAWPSIAKLGPEPLERAFTGRVLKERLGTRKIALKVALMNQELVVGVGNIYASEALFYSGISPLREAGQLTAAEADLLCAMIKKVLRASIEAGGSSLRDYRQASGELGFFQNRFAVYDREGKACPGCTCEPDKTGGIKRLVQGGRSTFYCPRKQS